MDEFLIWFTIVKFSTAKTYVNVVPYNSVKHIIYISVQTPCPNLFGYGEIQSPHTCVQEQFTELGSAVYLHISLCFCSIIVRSVIARNIIKIIMVIIWFAANYYIYVDIYVTWMFKLLMPCSIRNWNMLIVYILANFLGI